MKYIVHYGYGNKIETNSRNARKWLQDLGGDSVVITTKSDKFVCEAIRQYDDTIIVNTYDRYKH